MAVQRNTGDNGCTLTFVLTSEDPEGPVSVVGSFNDWTPGTHLLEAGPDGSRSVTVTVPAAQDVHFRYLGPEGFWFDDPDADEITADGSVLWARTDEIATEDSSEATSADPEEEAADSAESADSEQLADSEETAVSEQPADSEETAVSEEPVAGPEEPATPDESGERLEAVADLIDDAKGAARDLVDHDAMDPGDTEVFDGAAPRP